MEEKKSVYSGILIHNHYEKPVTIYFYYMWQWLCWISKHSVILKPGEEYFYQEDSPFQYQIKLKGKKAEKVEELKQNLFIIVSSCGKISNNALEKHEHKITKTLAEEYYSFKHQNKWKDTESLNYYKVLGVERKDLKNKDKEEISRELKQKRDALLLKYHPDKAEKKNLGIEISGKENEKIFIEVLTAYEILIDPYNRAQYNNQLDHEALKDRGWLKFHNYKKFFMSIFYPEPESEKEEKTRKKRLFKRIGMIGCSAAMVAGGTALTIFTAGWFAPLAMSLLSGGIAGLVTSVKTQKLEWKDFGVVVGLGMVAGGITGCANIGAISMIYGIPALSAGGVVIGTTVPELLVGLITGAGGGLANALAKDLTTIVHCKIKGEEIPLTWKKVLYHAFNGMITGACVGSAVGAIAGKLNVSSNSLVDQGVEQAVFPVARSTGKFIGYRVAQIVTGASIETSANTAWNFIEERADPNVENRSLSDHGVDIGKNYLTSSVAHTVANVGTIVKAKWYGQYQEVVAPRRTQPPAPGLDKDSKSVEEKVMNMQFHHGSAQATNLPELNSML